MSQEIFRFLMLCGGEDVDDIPAGYQFFSKGGKIIENKDLIVLFAGFKQTEKQRI